jgi:hypothetical protein
MAHAAQSQSGGMSAAGESGLCIVIATCAGASAIAALDAEVDALQRQARRLGTEPTAHFPPWVCSE